MLYDTKVEALCTELLELKNKLMSGEDILLLDIKCQMEALLNNGVCCPEEINILYSAVDELLNVAETQKTNILSELHLLNTHKRANESYARRRTLD